MKIAYGNSRMDKRWKNNDISWEDLCSRVRSTKYTTETVEEYRKMKKGGQDSIKDVGGFVGGHLKDGRRKKGNVLSRSMLTLDMDYGTPTIWDEIKAALNTHPSTPAYVFSFRSLVMYPTRNTPPLPEWSPRRSASTSLMTRPMSRSA